MILANTRHLLTRTDAELVSRLHSTRLATERPLMSFAAGDKR